MREPTIEMLRERANRIRRASLTMIHRAGTGHTGGDLSAADILATLYFAVLIANGTMVSRALDAAVLLADKGVAARVLNMSTVRPLDREAIIAAAEQTGRIVTVEEHTIYGGLGGAVAEVVATAKPVPLRILGIPGVFAPTGSAQWLLEHFGLTAEGIAQAALELTQRMITR